MNRTFRLFAVAAMFAGALAFWFRADAYPADSAGLVSKRDSISLNNNYTTWLKWPDRRIYVDIEGSDNRFTSSSLINTGAWYHVAVVFDGSPLRSPA
jgi:hypothetical protein